MIRWLAREGPIRMTLTLTEGRTSRFLAQAHQRPLFPGEQVPAPNDRILMQREGSCW